MSTVLNAAPPRPRIIYPESDGKPMGETEWHVRLLLDLLAELLDYFRDALDVYVGANMFVYYAEGEPHDVVAPDLFVVRGVPNRERRVYKVWEEGNAPEVVVELTSLGTRLEDLGTKKVLYAQLGVREYFVFDPFGDYLKPTLRGYRLVGEEYERLEGEALQSEILGLELRAEGKQLRLYHPVQGKLLTPLEAQDARREAEAETEKLRAELERLRAKK